MKCDKIRVSGISGCGAVGSARGSGLRGRRFKSDHPDQKINRSVAQLVARGVWDAEVASSSLVAPTRKI